MARPNESLDDLFAHWRSEPVHPAPANAGEARAGTAAVARALRDVAERRRRQQKLRKLGMALSIAAGVFGVALAGWVGYGELGSHAATVAGVAGAGGERLAGPVLVHGALGDLTITDASGRLLDVSQALGAQGDTLRLEEGYRLRTEAGSARLGFASGAEAQVSGQSSLKVTATRRTEALFLARGTVDVEVPKLDAERGFSVETPDSRVTVHGTRFSVNVETTDAGPRTHVSVVHGVVSVQHAGVEVRLTAGQEWPPPHTEIKAEVEAPNTPPVQDDASRVLEEALLREAQARQAASREGPVPVRRKAAGAAARVYDSRELSDQNQRFSRAMNLKKRGALQAALDELVELGQRYPASPLSQELRVEELRVLRGLGQGGQAALAARRYLRDFPHGYAEDEAREILAEQP